MATAVSSSDPSGSTWETIPMRRASAAPTFFPVRRISAAWEEPTARGSSQLTPSSVPASPLLIPAPQNTADSPARRMSAPRERHMPPP
jgi:hypothetical protein